MSKLNEEYFKTRDKHKKDGSPKSWVIVIPILLFFLGVMYLVVNGPNRVLQSEVMKAIDLGIQKTEKLKNATWVDLANMGLTIELHTGLKFNYSTEIRTLTATSQDSNEIAYLIGEVPLKMQKINMADLWINSSKEIDHNLTFRDTLDYMLVETVKDEKEYKGILKFKEIHGNQLVMSSVSIKSRFKELEPQMHKVFNSIKLK